jgi:uncharacterized protein (TIRG00374 family)
LALGIGGLAIVVYGVSERDALIKTFLNVDPWLVLVAFLLTFFATGVKTMRWWLVLRHTGVKIKLQRLFGTYLVGTFFGQFMPGSSMGGDAMRMVEMSADTGKTATSVSSVLVERAIGMLTILVSASVILLFTEHEEISLTFDLAIHTLAIGIVVGLIVLRKGWFVEPATRLMARFKLGKPAQKVAALSKELQGQLGRGRILFYMVLLSFLANAATMSSSYLVLLGLGERVPYLAFIPLIAMAVAVELIPVSPGALGLREATYVAFLTGFLGVAEAASLSTALIVRGIGIAQGVMGGLVLVGRGLDTTQRPRTRAKRATPSPTS